MFVPVGASKPWEKGPGTSPWAVGGGWKGVFNAALHPLVGEVATGGGGDEGIMGEPGSCSCLSKYSSVDSKVLPSSRLMR